MIEECIDAGWTNAELLNALYIISFYHSMSCFCISIGMKSEIDL